MTRELWIGLIDVVAGLAIYFAAKYLTPDIAEDVKFTIGLLQPFVLAAIAKFYGETVATRIAAKLR